MDMVKSQLEMLKEDSEGNVNYESWRFKLDLTLKSKKIFNIATGIELRPEGAETTEAVSTWVTKDLEAQTLIGLNCSSSIAKRIAKSTSSYGMLSKLNTLYGKKSDATVAGLQRQFFEYKYNDKKSVIENCMQIQDYADSLTAEGENVKESWIMQKILGILPSRLHHFRTAWDNVTGVDRSLTNLFDRLRLEEDRLGENESSKSASSSAFITKRVNKTVKSNSQKGTTVECFKCGNKGHVKSQCEGKPCAKYIEYCKNTYGCNLCKNKGHFARDCPNKNSNQSQSKSNQNNAPKRCLINISLSAASSNKALEREFENNWYQDCAATQHMSFHREWFTNYVELEEPVMVVIGDATELEGIGIGDIELEAFDGENWIEVILKQVLHTPKMPFNLLSVSKILDKGYEQTADAETSVFKDANGQIGAMAVREGNLFKMKFRRQKSESCLISSSLRKWHEKFAHQNIGYVREILKQNGIKYQDDWNDFVCPGCTYGKQHRVSHPLNPKTSLRTLDLIHVDLCEMNIYSLGGAKYFLLFKDDYSRFKTVYFLKNKSEAPRILENFLNLVQNQFERKVKSLRSDNGTEIKNCDTKEILDTLGIFHSKSSTYTPQQNGRIEREMRTVVEAARSVIHAHDLNENLWGEAVNYVVFTLNQTGTSSVKGKSPVELWFGRKMDVCKLRAFGSVCYVFIEDHKRAKTQKKSKKGIFVGYDLDSPGFRVFFEDTQDVNSSSNVVFDESTNIESFTELEIPFTPDKNLLTEPVISPSLELSEYDSCENEKSFDENSSTDSNYNPPGRVENVNADVRNSPRNLRDRQKLKPPVRFRYNDNSALIMQIKSALFGEVTDLSVTEALKDLNWKEAIFEEYQALIDMETWTLTERPQNVKPLTCRWVFTMKDNGKYKARLVVRGFEQKEGRDYFDVFSPVARRMSVRLILSIAASENMKLMTFDVKTAFLHGDLEEEIYMYQPEGFDDKTGRICKLQKSLYGLKQAPKCWNKKFSQFLENLDFLSSDDDPCVYYNIDRSIMIVLHVDDGLMVGKSESNMLKILEKLNDKFKSTYDTGRGKKFSYLGMQVVIQENGIFIHQSKYVDKILERFKLYDSNVAYTPYEPGMLTDPNSFLNDKPLASSKTYREAIGSLLYLATISRPDISFPVNYLSRFNNNPMTSHWKMVKRIFQYIKGTTKFGIFFDGDRKFIAYSDSDYGGDLMTRQSTSGVLIFRGGPLVWLTQKQHTVANSTAEAEYRAAVLTIDEICWLRRLASELNQLDVNKPTVLYVDNQSALQMLQNTHEGKITKGKKHIEISRKFIQQHIGSTIKLEHVKSADQLADLLTKPLSRKVFERLRCKIIKEEC